MGGWRRLRRLAGIPRGVLLLAAALTVVAASMLGIVELDRRARDAQNATAAVTKLAVAAHRLEAMMWRGAAVGGAPADLVAEGTAALASGADALARLHTLDPSGEVRRSVEETYAAYVDDLWRLYRQFLQHPEVSPSTALDPSLTADFAALQSALDRASATYEARTDEEIRVRQVGTAFVLLAAALALGGLWMWHQRGHKADARRLAAQEARFRALVHRAADLVTVVDGDGTIGYASPAVAEVLGHTADEVLGASMHSFVHPEDLPGVRQTLANLLAGSANEVSPIELRARHADGSWRWLELVVTDLRSDPAVAGVVINARDVTTRKADEARLAYQAFHDALTGLPNRALFLDRLEHAVDAAARRGEPVAVLYLDLDRFKLVNDGLGHDAGDALLVAVADRLARCVREADTLARLGGDEFAVLLEGATGEQAEEVAGRILDALRPPVPLAGHEVCIGASIGIALRTPDRGAPGVLLRDADVALYEAKRAGRGVAVAFVPGMAEAAERWVGLEAELRGALVRGEFLLHYQPIVDLVDGRVAAVEALARWRHPARGLVGPATFLPVAEETGLIAPITAYLLDEACRRFAAWQETLGTCAPESVEVNLAARCLRDPNLAGQVRDAVAGAGIDPSQLRLEVTERIFAEEVRAAAPVLGALRALGVRLAIDDFGAGVSALATLGEVDADVLKLDRIFAHELDDEGGRTLVTGVVALAHALGMAVTAEGIETAEQLAAARAAGCDRGQGNFFSPPLAPDELGTWLTAAALAPV